MGIMKDISMEQEDEPEVLYERISYEDWQKTKPNVKIQIIAKKGNRTRFYQKKYPEFDWTKDKLFFLKLIDLKNIRKEIEIPYSYNNQIELLKLVISNVILPETKKRDINRFKLLIESLEG